MSSQAPLEAISCITTFSGHTKGSMASESQVFLNNFKKGIKVMHQHTPSSRMTSSMITFRDLPWQSSKHKAVMMLLTQTLTLKMEINMTSNILKENPLCNLYWLLSPH